MNPAHSWDTCTDQKRSVIKPPQLTSAQTHINKHIKGTPPTSLVAGVDVCGADPKLRGAALGAEVREHLEGGQ
jgi:hypothetical protein